MCIAAPGLAALVEAIRSGASWPGPQDAWAVGDRTGRRWTYSALISEAASICERLRAHRPSGLLLLRAGQTVETVAALMGGLAAGYQVMLQPAALDDAPQARLAATFAPEAVFGGAGLQLADRSMPPIHAGAALLLSTSGTTGSAKFVRLPLAAIAANARQIVAALRIGRADVALAHLPLCYSYGLSVLTSHLEAGAAVHLTDGSFTDPAFWQEAAAAGATHLPGVPFHYLFLARGALASLVPASVTSFTQAGGALALAVRQRIHAAVTARGGRFYVMYGQTEAGPRMTTLDHDDFVARPDSVGRVLPEGRLRILDEDGRALAAGEEGEIEYSGPNLMAGYAEDRDALATPDAPVPAIRTGDRGVLDRSGFLTLRGRNRSFAKIGGLRLNLDDMVAGLAPFAEVAMLPGEEQVYVFHAEHADDALKAHIRAMAASYRLPVGSFILRAVSALPRHASGKLDFQRLRELAG